MPPFSFTNRDGKPPVHTDCKEADESWQRLMGENSRLRAALSLAEEVLSTLQKGRMPAASGAHTLAVIRRALKD